MQVQAATRLFLFSLFQLYAVSFAIIPPATVPSHMLKNLFTLNLTFPHVVTHDATSPSNSLPPDPSYLTMTGSRMRFYDYGERISPLDTAEILTLLFRMCNAHYRDYRTFIEKPIRLTAGSVVLYIDPGDRQYLSWHLLSITGLLLGNWLEMYEYRTLTFGHWYFGEWLAAAGTLSRVGAE